MFPKIAAALAATVCVLGVASEARADDEQRKKDLLRSLAEFDDAVTYFEEERGIDEAGRFGPAPATCTEIIEQLSDLHAPPTEVVHVRGNKQWLLRKAPEHCARYASVHALVQAIPALTAAIRDSTHLDGPPGGESTTRFAGFAVASGGECVKALDDAAQKGAVMDLPVKHAVDKDLTGAQLRTWCEELVKTASALAGASAEADGAKKQKARDRYAKFGAAGDKLSWLLEYDPDGAGKIWYLPPRCAQTEDPKTLAKAKVLIRWGENPDGTQVLRKLTFKGNKLVKDQSKTFDTQAKAYKFCK
jgi:hypothetical protein